MNKQNQINLITYLKDFTGIEYKIATNKKNPNQVYLELDSRGDIFDRKINTLKRLKSIKRVEKNGTNKIFIEADIDRINEYIKEKEKFKGMVKYLKEKNLII